MTAIRWRQKGEDGGQPALFDADEVLERHVGSGEFRGTEFLHVNAKRLINRVPASSRMPFEYTVNAYRGCSHACCYCFARPTHAYLGLDIGEDFERRIVVKVNAVERLRAELSDRRWGGDAIAMGTNTDPYQRAEGKYHLTRGIVEALRDAANPFSILTKSTLVLRDLDVIADAAARTHVRVDLSIGTLDRDVWKVTEPGTPPPAQRVEAVRRLRAAGIRCGVLVAPIIPGMSDRPEQIAEVVAACSDAGAVSISAVGLHLRPGVKEHFMSWLRSARPDLVPLYGNLYERGSYLPMPARRQVEMKVRAAREKVQGGSSADSPYRRRQSRVPAQPVASPPPAPEQPHLL